MLELTKINQTKVFIAADSVEAIDESEGYTIVRTKTGKEYHVMDHPTDIYMEYKDELNLTIEVEE